MRSCYHPTPPRVSFRAPSHLNVINRILAVCLFVALSFAIAMSASASAAEPPALKDVFAGKFLVGAALNGRIVARADHPVRPLVARHFNSVTAGNEMKWERYNPEPGVLRPEPADAFVALAEANGQHVLGHCLFWHQQTPRWVFEDEPGQPASREVLLSRMRERVRELAARYGDRVATWDVINETFLDDGTLRDSPFTQILGPDFIPEAFRIAAEELPAGVELLYNDYNMNAPGKRAAVVAMVHDLRARGIRIDGVGMQGHWRLRTPSLEDIEASIVAFAGAGVRVHITELDIEMLPRLDGGGADLDARQAFAADPANNPYVDGLPAEVQTELAQRYADIFRIFVRHADAIDRVTFWGVTDGDSWLNNWPTRGRTNHPLLFDRQGQPKPAFEAVIATASP